MGKIWFILIFLSLTLKSETNGIDTTDQKNIAVEKNIYSSIAWLENTQNNDGSWESNLYITSCVINALAFNSASIENRYLKSGLQFLIKHGTQNNFWYGKSKNDFENHLKVSINLVDFYKVNKIPLLKKVLINCLANLDNFDFQINEDFLNSSESVLYALFIVKLRKSEFIINSKHENKIKDIIQILSDGHKFNLIEKMTDIHKLNWILFLNECGFSNKQLNNIAFEINVFENPGNTIKGSLIYVKSEIIMRLFNIFNYEIENIGTVQVFHNDDAFKKFKSNLIEVIGSNYDDGKIAFSSQTSVLDTALILRAFFNIETIQPRGIIENITIEEFYNKWKD